MGAAQSCTLQISGEVGEWRLEVSNSRPPTTRAMISIRQPLVERKPRFSGMQCVNPLCAIGLHRITLKV